MEYYDAEEDGLPLFERFHIHEQLHKALDRKVWLPSGGSLIIEHTEALTVIDVNTGKNVGTSNLEETVFHNNLEAADEIARQLRLRDIGGIIVIDFIDMEIRENREAVVAAFREALARDKTRTQVFDISELGLVEMTRKRIGEGLLTSFAQACPMCEGRGRGGGPLDHRVSSAAAIVAGPIRVAFGAPRTGRGGVCVAGSGARVGWPTAMYAVIATGGKQERVESGQRIEVELLGVDEGTEVSFAPVLVVDGADVLATPAQLEGFAVTGTVVGAVEGPEDQRVHLQAPHQPAPPLRPPPALHHRRDHRHRPGLTREDRDVEDQGRRLHPQRPRLQRPAPRREGVRRHRHHRRHDHRAPAGHPLPPGPQRRAGAATTRCSPSPTAR